MPHVVDPRIRPLFCQIYEATRQHWLETGYGPSKDDLSRACGCSLTSIIAAVKALKAKGYVISQKHVIRGIKPTDLDRTLSTFAPKRDPWAELADDEPDHIYWTRSTK